MRGYFMDIQMSFGKRHAPLTHSLSAISAWGLAFGCVIGWGSFVMPGTTFLPGAGPLGTVIGIAVSAAMILVISLNYAYLIRKYPKDGGSYTYIRSILGEDHAFLTVWSLGLAYLSLLWANATAFILIGRYFIGNALQWGFHYTIAGYDVYLGEIAATILIQLLFGFLAGFAKGVAEAARTAFAVILFVSVVLLFFGVATQGGIKPEIPGFVPGIPKAAQILNITVLAPWMYVGFETVTNEPGVFRFSGRKILTITNGAILAGMTVYIFLTLIASANVPEGYRTWQDYAADLGNLNGLTAIPVFYNIKNALGTGGILLAELAVVSGLSTSVLGFYQATAQVLSTMAGNGILPAAFAREKHGVPRNAVFLIMLLSLPVPLLGRTAVGWNADVSTLSVSIVYAYISICAFITASRQEEKGAKLMGIAGLTLFSLVFFFLPADDHQPDPAWLNFDCAFDHVQPVHHHAPA